MKPQQQTVRVGGLERTLESFNAEMGQKVARALGDYHAACVTPLEARIVTLEALVDRLETPWWKRAFARLRRGR